MNTFNDYLKYRLRSSLLRTAAFAVIALILTYYSIEPSLGMWGKDGEIYATYYYEIEGGIYKGYLDMSSISSFLVIASAAIAALELYGFKNKRNLDTLYSLPLSRFQLALAHYVSGALQVFAVHTVCVLGALLCALPYALHLKLWFLPAYYVFSLIFGLGFYSFLCFFFSEGNTVIDGAIFASMWSFALMAFLGTLNESEAFARYLSAIPASDYKVIFANYENWGTAASPLWRLATVFTDMIGSDMAYIYHSDKAERVMDTFYMFYVWIGIYAACAYGYFRSFVRRGAEKVGEISHSPFGYRFIIPFYGFCFVFSIGRGWEVLLGVIVPILMLIGYGIYRRSAKIKKSDVITVCLAVAIIILIGTFRVIEHFIPFAAALVLTVICLVRLIKASTGKAGKKEVAKRAVLLALSLLLLALLIPGAYNILRYYGRMWLYPGMFY